MTIPFQSRRKAAVMREMGKNRTSFTSETAPRGGRPVGAKNKMTQAVLDNFLYILTIYNSPERIKQDLDDMGAYNRRRTLEGIAKYILPTLSENRNNNFNEGEVTIRVTYGEDGDEPNELPSPVDVEALPNSVVEFNPVGIPEVQKMNAQ